MSALIARMRGWLEMSGALEEVCGRDVDVRDYLIAGFVKLRLQDNYPAYLLGWHIFENVYAYLCNVPDPERKDVATELTEKVGELARACAQGELDDATVEVVRAAFKKRCEQSDNWKRLF